MFSEQCACHLGSQNRARSLHLNGVAVPPVKAFAPTGKGESRMHVSCCIFIKATVAFWQL